MSKEVCAVHVEAYRQDNGEIKIAVGAANKRILSVVKSILLAGVPSHQLRIQSGFFFVSGENREDLLLWFLIELRAIQEDEFLVEGAFDNLKKNGIYEMNFEKFYSAN